MNKPSKKHTGHSNSTPQTSGHPGSDEPMISKDEEMQLLVALGNGMKEHGLKGFTEAEAHAVWTWARKTRVENAMLELALAGLMAIAIRKDGELIFKAIGAAPTTKL